MFSKPFIENSLLLLVVCVGLFPVFYFSVVELGIAEAAAGTEYAGIDSDDPADRYLENLAFGVGEKLTFEVKYGFISAGTAEMEVVRLVEFENRPCYQIVTKANSNSFFSSFYKVEDRVESIMDATGLFSLFQLAIWVVRGYKDVGFPIGGKLCFAGFSKTKGSRVVKPAGYSE